MMLLLEKKAKCPLCGARNHLDARRCSICTRPLPTDDMPSKAVYEEALWSSRIASKGSRKKTSPYTVLGIILVAAVILNYFVLGLGPSWAHEPKATAKGQDWRVNRDQPDYVVDLPGTPIVSSTSAFGTTLTTSSVWVDNHWDLIRDADTQSVGRLADARAKVHAGLIIASGAAPADPAAAMTGLVQALQPRLEVPPGGVSSVQDPSFGQEFTLTSPFSGFPEDADSGTVRATAIVANGRIWIAVSLVRGGDDAALHARLVENFIPAGAPAPN